MFGPDAVYLEIRPRADADGFELWYGVSCLLAWGGKWDLVLSLIPLGLVTNCL